MRKILCLIAGSILLASCSNQDDLIVCNDAQTAAVTTVNVVDGVIKPHSRSNDTKSDIALSFADEKSFQDFKATLEGMTSAEKMYVVNQYGVLNLHDVAKQADSDLEEIGSRVSSEAEFRREYAELVKKYAGVLITNPIDETDLDLYVPEEDNVESYIANQSGIYVVNNEIRQVELKSVLSESVASASKQNVSPLANNEHLNSYIVEPQDGKKVYFTIARKVNTIHITMYVKKKMWYGWKNDPHRDLIFEPYFSSVSPIRWLRPNLGRFWAGSKEKLEDDLLVVEGSGALKGIIYTWTDMTAEHDANGNLIIEKIGNTNAPRCLVSKSEIVNVNLPYVY